MWPSENDVILSAASYFMACKKNNKLKSVRKPTSFGDPAELPLFQLANDDAYSKQCGKIFITNQLLIFHCAFCSERYGTLFDFSQHISAMHLQKKKIKIINAAELSDSEETPIIECVPVLEYLSLGVGNKAFADNIPSSIKKTTKKPISTHLHGQKEIKKPEINQATVNSGKMMPITELEPVQEHSEVRGDLIVEDKTNSIKKTPKNPIVEQSSSKTKEKPMQNKTTRKGDEKETDAVTVEETTEMETADIKSEVDFQDEASISSLEDLEPIMYSKDSFKPLPYKCDKCNKAFARKYYFTRHIKSHDKNINNDKNYKCTLCEKTFKHKQFMDRHLLRHSGEKKFNCKVCDKRFYTNTEVALHQRMHTGERPYVCFKCGKDFKTSANFNTHMKRTHFNIREKKCDICSKAFFSNCELRNHMAGHSDERPFACTQCSATFTRKTTLTEHIKIHTNARQYKCTGCDKSFNQLAALSLHKNNIHKIL